MNLMMKMMKMKTMTKDIKDLLTEKFKRGLSVMDLDFENLLNGNEKYFVFGDVIPLKLIKPITYLFKGLTVTGNCLEKNLITYTFLKQHNIIPNEIEICVGSMFVTWKDKYENITQYGFTYNPPLEFHCWLEIENNIIDFALAGTIIRGQNYKDEKGYFLQGLNPFILNGECPPFLIYKKVQRI